MSVDATTGLRTAELTDLVHGSGEMAERIRAFPWSETVLGPVRSWPEPLLTLVNGLLACALPVQVLWGPEMISIYNDAIRPAFTDKHPAALGCPARTIWPEIWPVVEPQLLSVLEQGKPLEFREVMLPLLNDGVVENQYWDYSYSPIVAADGTVLGILNISKNVTATVQGRRQVEEILSVTTDGMMLVDRQWNFLFFNERAKAIGQVSENLVGQNLWEVFPLLRYEGSPYEHFYGRAMEHGEEAEFDAEYGAPLNLSLKVFVKPVEGGILVIFRDVTAEKQAQAALMQTEKLAAVGKLAGSIAHEINNPLESVTNLLYLARHGDPAELQTYLSLAERELRRVSVIANQTLRFYRQSTRPTSVTCGDLFDSVLNIYQGRLVNSQIRVEKRKRAVREIECFEGEIRQVLTNLIGNAIDAMHPDGGHLLVRSREATDWRSGRRGMLITVADTGCGMNEATRAKLFEAFYTTKGIGGTGLGLWVSQEIVERHEGRMRVRSREADNREDARHGTVFTLFLPFDAVIRAGA